MSTSTYKRFEDPESGSLPDKMTVYQECLQAFNASPIKAKKCRALLSRLLRLLYNGETFQKTEATNLFFSVSKLFHNADPSLRQLGYLAIKELCSISDDVLMITASIMKDIQGAEPVFKPDAIRTLSRVLDGSTIHAAERAMRNCIVDSNQAVCSAALVSTYHMLPVARDVVRRWANEAQEAISASKTLVRSPYTTHDNFGASARLPQSTYFHQYHALGLLYHLKKQDRMAMLKLIQQLTSRQSLQSSFAVLQLVRYVASMLQEDTSGQLAQQFWPLFNSWLNNKSEMVELDAAKVVLAPSSRFNQEQQLKAITTLQELLSVPRTVTRFSAVRLLSRVALADPEMVRACNSDLESLVNDPCRSISTYAITTLLKTGNAQSVDRLVKTIAGFMGDISDEFKVVVVEAVRTLTLKFPEKHSSLLVFLGDALRDEGGYNFKNSVIEAIFDIVKFVPDAREAALELFCEFIEDCEYTELAVRVLHLLGEYGPKAKKPSLYVRHIYNRVVLENSIVRSSAVIALSKFALVGDKQLTASIRILLQRCLQDVDDEVRDRTALSLRLVEGAELKSSTRARALLQPETRFSLAALEQQLCRYVRSKDKTSFSQAFDIKVVPRHTEEEILATEYKAKIAVEDDMASMSTQAKMETITSKNEAHILSTEGGRSSSKPVAASDLAARSNLLQQQYSQELSGIDEFQDYGLLLHSSGVVELTERETEFIVTAVKHVFKEHIVIQYNVENTLKDIQVEDVTVMTQLDTDDYKEETAVPAAMLKPDSSVCVYVSFSRPADHRMVLATMTNSLAYVSKDVDESTGEPASDDEGFPDEYQIEDLAITPGDFVTPCFTGSFTSSFDGLNNEEVAVYNLGRSEENPLAKVVKRLSQSMSMTPLEGSDMVDSSASHTLKLFGKSINGDKVAALVKLVSSSKGVMMKTQVRSSDSELAQMLANQWE
ncbi:hypothetical protein FOA43_002112 [Brettanomyces nanus]|uniref:Coatomer subunit gamma n=1 Tax=Eeniella nana TaxID=13502 RepID=A0A875S1E8_EENNA|nr:uncharacterized protein FOA43_002112 [Brettanomyces nanus]QPG74778.1 hypothetical protein FOA43_002112 [Brettanomyces nanus]